MVASEVYDRIELICKMLQYKDMLNEHIIDRMYDELESLCEVILADRMKPIL
jgi:hypothetical protein